MSKDNEEPRFHIIQPLRDPESNWGVDLAKNLEEYLMKICSGEVIGEDDGHLSINFAEAALLLQGSVQVYSRKVEYLYTLVLHALEFLSQKRQQDQTGETSGEAGLAEENNSSGVVDDENEPFLGLDEIPVDAKNCLDDGRNKGHNSSAFVKPPANLVVLEGDCFDSIGDVGELESYLLATNDLYRDFILLDPCDSESVDKFLDNKGGFGGERGSQGKSNTYKSPYRTPRKVGGSAFKSPLGKTVDRNVNKTPEIDQTIEVNETIWPENDFPENDHHGFDTNDGYQEPVDDDSDEEDDPWKPLNPHETGTLKVKPFKKGKIRRSLKIPTTKIMSLASQFPVAKLDTIINPEYKEIWETKHQDMKHAQDSEFPPLYEKLRQSLTIDENEADNYFANVGEDTEEDNDNNVPDFGHDDFTVPETTFTDGPLDHEMNNGGGNDFEPEDPDTSASLEDLCRSHLDALLASIAENEKQTELAARVSTWKQRIESTLDEQDSHPPFDIHEYGERVLNKLLLAGESSSGMSFSDVVQGQEKHDVARTFSALLQLVNNRSVDLDKGDSSNRQQQPVCFTASNPFHVRLLSHCKKPDDPKFKSKKRGKSPLFKLPPKTPRTKTSQ